VFSNRVGKDLKPARIESRSLFENPASGVRADAEDFRDARERPAPHLADFSSSRRLPHLSNVSSLSNIEDTAATLDEAPKREFVAVDDLVRAHFIARRKKLRRHPRMNRCRATNLPMLSARRAIDYFVEQRD